MSMTITTLDPALKQLYSSKNVAETVFKKRPLLGLLPKREDFGGRNMPIVNLYGNPMGRSAAFATAQANASSASMVDFLLTRVNDYSVATITGEAIEASRNDKYAFLQGLKTQVDGAMNALSDALETFLFRSGTGSIGQVGSYTATQAVFTLNDVEDVANFEVGMEIVSSATDGGSLRTGSGTISAVDRTAGTVTSDAAWDTGITSFAANDYVAVQGDAANGSSNVKVSGLAAWCPASAPSATAFFGVDRTADSRLYGSIHDGSSQSIETALIYGQSKAAALGGGAPDVAIINHAQYRKLVTDLGSKKNYDQVNSRDGKGVVANIGYRSLVVDGDHGPIDVVASNKCQATTAYALDTETWTLASLGPCVKMLMEDQNRILRQASADGYEVRIGFRGNLGCKAPARNANIALPAVA